MANMYDLNYSTLIKVERVLLRELDAGGRD